MVWELVTGIRARLGMVGWEYRSLFEIKLLGFGWCNVYIDLLFISDVFYLFSLPYIFLFQIGIHIDLSFKLSGLRNVQLDSVRIELSHCKQPPLVLNPRLSGQLGLQTPANLC